MYVTGMVLGAKRKLVFDMPVSMKKAKVAVKKRKRVIKGAISTRGKELNYTDVAITNKACTAAGGTVTLLNGIAENDDNTDRNGRQVSIKSVQFHGQLAAAVALQEAQLCRVIAVWDNAPNGAAPLITDIFTADSSYAFPLVNNQKRFTILRDCKYAIGASVNTATQAQSDMTVALVDFYVKINSVTQFSGTGATIASIQNGALFLCTLGSAAHTTRLDGTSRIRFAER